MIDVTLKGWNLNKGYLFIVCAAVLWASSGTAGKLLFQSGVTPWDVVQARTTIAAVALALVYRIRFPERFRVSPSHLPGFIVHGGLIMSMVQLSYFFAISKIQVAAAIFLEYLAPVFVALFAVIFWKERMTGGKISALILALGGCYLVVGAYNLQLFALNKVGVAWGLSAAFFFAATSLLGEYWMRRYHPWTVLFYTMLFAAVSLNLFASPLHFLRSGFSAGQWVMILYISVFGTIVPFGLFFSGISHVRATRATIVATLEPIAAGVLSYLLVGESLEYPQILGGIFVIAAIAILQLCHERDEGISRNTNAEERQ
ncbi:MAG: EamA family transporter [Deltaproteobacteria bacterium]|nr:EamA family transporter [Deltaproteobacteria bacterium]